MAPNATSTTVAAVAAGHAPDVLSDEFGFQPDDVVVSGFSGRFPECDSVDELRENLYSGYDMVNDDPRRWPYGKSLGADPDDGGGGAKGAFLLKH